MASGRRIRVELVGENIEGKVGEVIAGLVSHEVS